MRVAALVLALLAVAGCTPRAADLGPIPDRTARREALRQAGTFATVLSRPATVDALAVYDVAILEPEHYTVEDLRALRQRGVLTLGYVNIGEVEAYRDFADQVDPAWVLGENPRWPGHKFVDAREAGWRELVVGTAAARVVAREFDGLFLDMADVAAPGVFPETEDGVVAVIEAIREAYPTHALVMNRGLFLLERVGEAVDGLLVEGVWARYDAAQGTYRQTVPAERDRLLQTLLGFRDGGGAALVIDYADTDALADYARAEAAAAGLPIFVGTLTLADTPPPPDLGVD